MLGVWCPAAEGQGDPGPMIADRPGAANSAAVVAVGYYHVEMGWSRTERSVLGGGELVTTRLPELLVRVGLTPRLEARVGFEGFIREELEGSIPVPDVSGAGTPVLAAKYLITAPLGDGIALALVGGSTLPG